MRKIVLVALALLLAITGALVPGRASATPLAPFIDLQERGLTLVQAGAGLEGLGSGSRTLSVDVQGPVRFALLYWAGMDQPCQETSPGDCSGFTQPFRDQEMIFNGTPLTGTVIGTETQPAAVGGPALHLGYFADVTSIVSAAGVGSHTFTFADGNLSSNLAQLDGVTLFVAYTNPSDPNTYRVLIWDGLDFAFGADPAAGDNRVVQPVVFNHGANISARQAQLYVVAGGATASLPDQITVSNNPTIANALDSSAGAKWDSDQFTIAIPSGVGTTSVQLISPASGTPSDPSGCMENFWKRNPGVWAPTGYSPSQTAGSVFALSAYPNLASRTLRTTLDGGGGNDLQGAVKVLLRKGVAALLNASHPELNYPRDAASVIADVNAAIASNNRATIRALADALDADNNLGCEFAASGDAFRWEMAALRVQQVDLAAPTCSVSIVQGSPAQATVTIQDTDSGLAEIPVTKSENADTVVPPFTVGTTDPVVVTSTKIDQAQVATVEIRVTDLVGNVDICEIIIPVP